MEQSKKWFENLQSRLSGKEVKDIQHIFYESAKDLMNNFTLKIDSLAMEPKFQSIILLD